MALFKIYRGQEDTLPAQINPGWCYYCWDTNHFYIDSDAGRKCINYIPANLSDLSDLVTDVRNTQIETTQMIQAFGTAAKKDVAESGNATDSQVVMGNDTRLSDARVASDVYPWAKAETKPSYNATEVGALSSSLKGANNGLAELDGSGKVPSSQLPSYVDLVATGDGTVTITLSFDVSTT